MAGAAIAAIIASEYNSAMDAVSWSMRSLICAAPGSRLLAADFANIEGRMLAWLAGEQWKLQAFRAYDAGDGPDLYKVAAGKILGIEPGDVSKPQRQLIGKPAELGLGYGGGPGAILTMMKNGAVIPWLRRDGPPPKKVTLDDIAGAVREAVSPRIWADAASLYARGALESAAEVLEARRLKALAAVEAGATDADLAEDPDALLNLAAAIARKNRLGLAADHWTGLRVIVDLWRQSNFAIARFWRDLEDAAVAAIENPGTIQAAGPHIKYCKKGDFLYCRLPSGRMLSYPYARLRYPEGDSNWRRPRIIYDGIDPYTKKWGEQEIYGGLLSENVTQAAARDVLRDALLRLRAAGYRVVMHVHDEIVCEMPNGKGSLSEMSALMATVPEWARGTPIAVDGWEGKRYRK
jgi:DNA polymerase